MTVEANKDLLKGVKDQVSNSNSSKAPQSLRKETLNPQPASSQCRATRYAVKFEPPCFCLEYQDESAQKRVRQVKLTKICNGEDPDRLTKKIIRSFPRHLDARGIKHAQIRKLVLKLLEHIRSSPEKSERQSLLSSPSLTREGSLKRLSSLNGSPSGVPTDSMPPSGARGSEGGSAPAAAASAAHYSLSYSEERLSSSFDDGLGKESRLSKQPSSSITAPDHKDGQEDKFNLSNALEDLDKEFEDVDDDVELPGLASSQPSASNVTRTLSLVSTSSNAGLEDNRAAVPPGKSRFGQEAETLTLEVDVEGDVDLNKVTDMELKLAKQKMDEKFSKNRVLPGDPEFEYDKQVEFGPPTENNDWDESEEETVPSSTVQPTMRYESEEEALPASTVQPTLMHETHPSPPEYPLHDHKVSSSGLSEEDDAEASIGKVTVQPNKLQLPGLSNSSALHGGLHAPDDYGDSYSYGDHLSGDEESPVSVPDELSPTRFDADHGDESLDWP
ncbi:hypothetical protein CEUSTIGMA_g7562.t1 [Chlamydomonas eustigma]|uniref:Centrosomal protein of 19 kDa n=1 Tax=Chlamydomonas eustigma TaxID=1157962 RepID=A0A250XAN9_9CHLO|nr:hypothetical protein CEUSTIGMA_g7562.t1 [Chlamydomonas eustigma]|eukprot:GAX80124.1 hypothetical protein CEUSTIGMA_g7562.t1 [Chlamydomonas eustigma]